MLICVVKPFFRTQPANETRVAVGGTVSLYCDIDGRPKPRVIWLGNNLDVVVNSSRITAYLNGTLVIRNVVEEDYGDYRCHAAEYHDVSRKIKLERPLKNEGTEKKIGEL